MKKSLFMFIAAMVIMAGFNKAKAQVVIPEVPAELKQTVEGYVESLKNYPDPDAFKKMLKKDKIKDNATLIAIGYRFLQEDMLFNFAVGMAQEVYEKDPKCLAAMYLEGDAFLKLGDMYQKAGSIQAASDAYGKAANRFEEAKTVDPDGLDPYLKLVGVYRYINPEYAIELMQEIQSKKTDDPKVNQVLGTLYYQLGDTLNARNFYNKYFEKFPDGQGDITVQREYVIILFMAKDYNGALTQCQKFAQSNSNDPVLRRITFLATYEVQNAFEKDDENQMKSNFDELKAPYEANTKAAYDKFYGVYPDSVYQEIDYRYQAQYLTGVKDYPGAVAAYKKAAEVAPEDAPTQFNLSKAYEKTKEFGGAIEAYKKYMELTKKTEDTNELYKLGQVYYRAANAAQADSLLRIKYIKEGDDIFAKVDAEMVKSGEPSYLGVFWRSRINQLVDKKHPNEVAAGYMKETLKRLEDPKFNGENKEDYNPHRAQAYSYLAWLAMEKDDNAAAKANAVEALKCEEDNALASNVKRYLELVGGW